MERLVNLLKRDEGPDTEDDSEVVEAEDEDEDDDRITEV